MAAHLPKNKKYQLTGNVLDGMSIVGAGRKFGVPESTCKDIFYNYVDKFFFDHEKEKFQLHAKSKKADYQRAWRLK